MPNYPHNLTDAYPVRSSSCDREIRPHNRKKARIEARAFFASQKITTQNYQTRHEFSGIIGWPTLQPNALPNSSKFCTVPFVRHSPVL